MRKAILLLFTTCLMLLTQAQPVVFQRSQMVRMIRPNATDTLSYAFTGGLNSPQFCTIDLNGDGKKDLFVFERQGNKIMTFLNQGNGVYSYEPKYASQFPPLTNWVQLKDYNCDGKEDIFSEVDPMVQPEPNKPIYTSGIRVIKNVSTQPGVFKWLQTKNQLYDTGVAGNPPINIAFTNTDYPGIADMDNDGDLDLVYFPISLNVFTYNQNLSKEKGYNCDSLIMVFRDQCWGYTYYKVNAHGFGLADNSPCFRNYKHAAHNGATVNLFDADGDGDKDMLYGDVGYNSLIFLKNGKSANPRGRDTIISQDTLYPRNSVQAAEEIFPASFILDVDGDTKNDLLVAPNASEAAKNKNQVMYYRNTGTTINPVFTYQQNDFLVNGMFDLGGGAYPTFVDIDGDGDQDVVVATQGEYTESRNSNDRLVLLKNTIVNGISILSVADTNFLNINTGSTKTYRMYPTFGDLTGDGKPDLILGDLNGKLHYFQNTSVSSSQITFSRISDDFATVNAGTCVTPQLIDMNKDGKLDIVMGRKNGTLTYFENKGTTTAPQFSSAPTIDSIGRFSIAQKLLDAQGNVVYIADGYSVPYVCDLDTDGHFEVLVGSDQGKVYLYRNFDLNPNRLCTLVDSIFTDDAAIKPFNMSFGFKSAPFGGDLNKDGKPDLLIGNIGGGLQLYQGNVKGIVSGIAQTLSNDLKVQIYPNPFTETFKVSIDQSLLHATYRVINMQGEDVVHGMLAGYETNIDLSGKASGIYFISIKDDSGLALNRKLIKQ